MATSFKIVFVYLNTVYIIVIIIIIIYISVLFISCRSLVDRSCKPQI